MKKQLSQNFRSLAPIWIFNLLLCLLLVGFGWTHYVRGVRIVIKIPVEQKAIHSHVAVIKSADILDAATSVSFRQRISQRLTLQSLENKNDHFLNLDEDMHKRLTVSESLDSLTIAYQVPTDAEPNLTSHFILDALEDELKERLRLKVSLQRDNQPLAQRPNSDDAQMIWLSSAARQLEMFFDMRLPDVRPEQKIKEWQETLAGLYLQYEMLAEHLNGTKYQALYQDMDWSSWIMFARLRYRLAFALKAVSLNDKDVAQAVGTLDHQQAWSDVVMAIEGRGLFSNADFSEDDFVILLRLVSVFDRIQTLEQLKDIQTKDKTINRFDHHLQQQFLVMDQSFKVWLNQVKSPSQTEVSWSEALDELFQTVEVDIETYGRRRLMKVFWQQFVQGRAAI